MTDKFGTTSATVVKELFTHDLHVRLDVVIVTVPNVADGDYPINVTVGGQALQQGTMYLSVHK